MVFVSMGKYDTLDLVGMLSQVSELRKDEIDTRHISLWEHKPTVD